MPTGRLDDSLVRGLIESAPDALVLADAEGQIVFVNAQAEVLFGYPRDELTGQPVEILIPEARRTPHAEKRAAYTAAPQRRAMGSGLFLTCRRRDGAELPVEVSLSPVTTPSGVFIAAAVRDISARLGIQKALHDAEERFRLTFKQAPIGMAMVSLDGYFLRVNQSLCQLVGYSREELTGLTFLAITHPDDRGLHLAAAEQLGRGAIPLYQVAKRYIRKDGSIVEIMLSVSTVRDTAGVPLYNIAQIEDITKRKRAEEALLRSESELRSFVEQASDGIFVADMAGRFTSVNTAACQLFGYRRDELIGKPIVDTFAPEEALRLAAAKEFLLHESKGMVAEWMVKRKDGALVPTEISTKIFPDGRWQAFVRDISERRLAQEALRVSEEHLARAQSVAHIGSWDWDLRTNKVNRSAELFKIYGIKPEPQYSHALSMMDWVHPEDRKRLTTTMEAAVREGRDLQCEYRILRTADGERTVLLKGDVVHEDGRLVRIVGTVMDITERKSLERAREDSLRWLHAVLDQCPVAIILVHGAHGERVEFNRHAHSLLGHSADAGQQNADLVLFHEKGPPPTGDNHPSARALRGERITGLALSLKAINGAVVPILLDAAPIRDIDGTVQGAVIVFQDITVLKQLDRLRAEWNSVIAHDLRQPVNTIALIAQLVARKKRDPAELEKLGEQIIQAALRLNRMINDLLDFSRLEVRQLTLARRPVELPKFLATIVERTALEAPDRRFDLRIGSEIPTLNIDADRIAQVTENLLSNAIKYGDPETPIVVSLDACDEAVTVAITNTGPGIAPEALPNLFQRFRRVQDAKSGLIKGVGLGLYIVQQLIEAHGGQVTASSTPGGTTTFRFTLPTPNKT